MMKERRWCVRDQQKKPYMSFDAGGKQNDPSTWLSYDEAEELLKTYPDKFTGLGLYFSMKEGSNLCLCGIDIDAIHHDADHPNPLADKILDAFKGTYAEWSPSKTGYHILLYVDMTQFPFDETNYPFRQNNREIGLEAYVGTITNRYFTFTGDKLEDHNSEVTDQTEQFLDLLMTYMQKLQKKQRITTAVKGDIGHTETVFDLDARLDLIRRTPRKVLFETLFDKGDISKFTSASEADFALISLLVPWLEGNPTMLDRAYRQSALFKNGQDEKWDSKRGANTYGERTIIAAINASDEPYYSEDPEYATGDNVSPEDIVRMINEVQQENRDKVSVLPFACGLGKSTAISYKIAEVLKSDGTDGLIVVTDRVDRMHKYKTPTDDRLEFLRNELELHGNEISILEHETIREEEARQNSCRVLIMSTQRFLQILTRDQIIGYTSWEHGKRPLILIDERPGVLEQKRLTIKNINAVEEILGDLRPNNNDVVEQDWCVKQWEHVAKVLKEDNRKYSRMRTEGEDSTYFFCQHNLPQMTEDDERFYRFISANSYVFYQDKKDYIGTIKAAHRFLTGWSIVERTYSKNTWTTKYYSLIDYQDKIKDIGAKVIILDGTADLSPEYNSDLYDVKESPAYRRWLDRLKINLVNYPTTREALSKEDPQLLAEQIKNYAWRRNKGKGRRSVVFTYKAKDDGKKHLETELQALFNNEESPCNVDHLGAIHGKNDYNDASLIIQFGLHQFSRSGYMLYAINDNALLLDKLKNMSEEQASAELKKLERSYVTEHIRSRLILTDIEQNFYRGCIRMSNTDEKMSCDIFFSVDKYPELFTLMLLRYLPLHARIENQPRPKEFIALADAYREGSIPDRLRRWLAERKPGVFTYDTIKEETGITTAQISQVRSRHEDIKAIFKHWQHPDNKDVYIKPKTERKYTREINQKKKTRWQ